MLADQGEQDITEAGLHALSIIGFQRVVPNGNIRLLGPASIADDEQDRGNSAVRMQTTGSHNNPYRFCRDVVDAHLLQ
jgi:hypothetical protein